MKGSPEDAARLEAVKKIVQKVEEKLAGATDKATLGDYIKLLQLQKDMEEETVPKEIRVRWVEPTTAKPLK